LRGETTDFARARPLAIALCENDQGGNGKSQTNQGNCHRPYFGRKTKEGFGNHLPFTQVTVRVNNSDANGGQNPGQPDAERYNEKQSEGDLMQSDST
jgi:hypothetical protein